MIQIIVYFRYIFSECLWRASTNLPNFLKEDTTFLFLVLFCQNMLCSIFSLQGFSIEIFLPSYLKESNFRKK